MHGITNVCVGSFADATKRSDASFKAIDGGEEVLVIREDRSRSLFEVDWASRLGTAIHVHWPCYDQVEWFQDQIDSMVCVAMILQGQWLFVVITNKMRFRFEVEVHSRYI